MPAAVAARFAGMAVLHVMLSVHPISAAESGGAGQILTPSAQEMTKSLLSLIAQYRQGPTTQRALLDQILDLARTRRQLLEALIADEPATVLQALIPAAIRETFPPAVQAYAEQAAEVEGVLEIMVEDRPNGSRVHYALLPDRGQRLALSFASRPPRLLTGSRVRVRGVQVSDTLALASGGGSDVETMSLVVPNTFGAQTTVVLLVNFQDNAAQPYTVASANSVVFTTTSSYYLEQSYQQTWLTGDVFGWFTIPMSSTVCDYGTLANYANSAATAAGVNLSAYTHYVYAFPQNACTWSGLGSVGGNPSQAWINGGIGLQVVAHELGHNLGLYHAHGFDCGSSTLGSTCTVVEYGDKFDDMGGSPGHFGAFQKERLGWLNHNSSPPITTVQSTGTYALDPYESLTSNAKALKILKSTDPTTGAQSWYYVEYRQALGFDGFLAGDTNALYGVVVHVGSNSDPNSDDLLDMTPSVPSWGAPALDVWQSFYDPDAGVGISPISATGAGALVSVSLGAPPGPIPCVRANPLLTAGPPSQTVLSGMAANYTVSVANHDNSGCGTSSFALQAAVPVGWTAAFGSPTLSISPGGVASTTLQVASPFSASGGSYSIDVSGSNALAPTYSGSTSMTYIAFSSAPTATATPAASSPAAFTATPTAAAQFTPTVSSTTATFTPTATYSPTRAWTPTGTPTFTATASLTPTPTPGSLSVTVSTSQSTYLRGQLVSVTANVTTAGSAASGAAVTFTITKSNGAIMSQTATTSSSGSATYQLRLKKQDPTGTYQVRAGASLNGATGSAATTFTVQ